MLLTCLLAILLKKAGRVTRGLAALAAFAKEYRDMTKHAEGIMQQPLTAGEQPKTRTEPQPGLVTIPQYSLRKILLVWAAAALPMALLGWVVAPALAHDPQNSGFERLAVLTVGLVWQFMLVMILLYQEAGNLRWSTIRQRLWLQTPRSPRTGKPRGRLDRKSTRLNSSHVEISYAVFCLKKKKINQLGPAVMYKLSESYIKRR